jgi:peptidoglycan hydrolase-like protein with peptidoglycan-binding domain/ribosomal protein L37AE/L43A
MTSLTQQPFAGLDQMLAAKKFTAATFDESLITRSANGQFASPGAKGSDSTGAGGHNSVGEGGHGKDVEKLQGYLQKLGYTTGTDAKGVFGKGTDAAVRKYQAEHGLKVDGLAGVHTFSSLRDHLAAGSSNGHSHTNGHAAQAGHSFAHGGAARFQPGGGTPSRIATGGVVGGTPKPSVRQGKDTEVGLERKTLAAGEVKSLDPDQGIVEAIVSVTGIKDRVNDIIKPGAYAKTLAERVPKGVHSHDWDTPVSKTLEAVELMPGDSRLPKATPAGAPWPSAAGGLLVKMQFNLETQRGREAFSDVKFYGKDAAWSIGYNVPSGSATFERKSGTRNIHELELFEYSPVLHGAAPEAGTLSVKSAQQAAAQQSLDDEGTGTGPGEVAHEEDLATTMDAAPTMASHPESISSVSAETLQTMHDEAATEIAAEIAMHLQQAAEQEVAAAVHNSQQREAGLASKTIEWDAEAGTGTIPTFATGTFSAPVTGADLKALVEEKVDHGNAQTLRDYWAHGEGAAKIGWGTPGDFDRCVAEVGKYMPGQAEGYCQLRHHDALGIYTGTHAKLDREGHPNVPTKSEFDENFIPESKDVWTGSGPAQTTGGFGATQFGNPPDAMSQAEHPATEVRECPHCHRDDLVKRRDGDLVCPSCGFHYADAKTPLDEVGNATKPYDGARKAFNPTEARDPATGKWRAEFAVDGKWYTNAMRYDTPEAAKAAASDKFSRWTQPEAWRVVPHEHPEKETYDGTGHGTVVPRRSVLDGPLPVGTDLGKHIAAHEIRNSDRAMLSDPRRLHAHLRAQHPGGDRVDPFPAEDLDAYQAMHQRAHEMGVDSHTHDDRIEPKGDATSVETKGYLPCPKCHSRMSAGSKCADCGASLAPKFGKAEPEPEVKGYLPCPKCHSRKAEGAKCADCGASLAARFGGKSRMSAGVDNKVPPGTGTPPVGAQTEPDPHTLIDNGDPTRSAEDDQNDLEPENWLPCPNCKANDPVMRTGKVVCAACGTAVARKTGQEPDVDTGSEDYGTDGKGLDLYVEVKVWSGEARIAALLARRSMSNANTEIKESTMDPTFQESALAGSMEDLQARLTAATDTWASKSDGAWTQIEGTWPDHVLFTAYDAKAEAPRTSWQVGFEITEDGQVELGEPQQVEDLRMVVPPAVKAITGLARLMEAKGIDPDLLTAALDRIAEQQERKGEPGLDEVELLEFEALKEFGGAGLENKRDYSHAERMAMAATGEALPDGSFPIKDKEDLDNAKSLRRAGDGKDPAAADAHIAKREAELGVKSLHANGFDGGTGGAMQVAQPAPGSPGATRGGNLAQQRAARMLQSMHEEARNAASDPHVASDHATASTYLGLAAQHLDAGNVETAKGHLGRALSAHDRAMKDGEERSFGRVGGRAVGTVRTFLRGAISQDDAGGDTDHDEPQVTSGARGHAGNIRGLEAAHGGEKSAKGADDKVTTDLSAVADDADGPDDDDDDVETDLGRVQGKAAKGRKSSKAQAALFGGNPPADLAEVADDSASMLAEFEALQAGL